MTKVTIRSDCLIMTGGEDIDPSYYNEEPDPNLEEVNEERDVSDMAFMQAAIDTDFPTLCTCRGMQVLNVASGGSLYQDIPTTEQFKEHKVVHRDPEEIDFTYHDLTIEEDSQLARIVGDADMEFNSWHHQGIKDLAPGLEIMARAEDGLVESFRKPDSRFFWAVQWHPEMMFEHDENSRKLFAAFIDACK